MFINFLINTAQAVSLPTFGGGQDLPAFISSVYSFALTAVGIAVFIRILWAGFLLLTAAGNASKAGDAKNKIQSAVIGAILLFAAYLILYIINPDLVKNTFKFSIPQSSVIAPTTQAPPTNPTPGGGGVGGVPGRDRTSSRWSNIVKAQEGIYFFTVKVLDANGDSFEQDYSMEILPNVISQKNSEDKEVLRGRFHPNDTNSRVAYAAAGEQLNIVTPFVPDGKVGQPYFAEIVAVGGQPPYVYSISDGALPDGLILQAVLEMPILTIENLTAQRTPSYFYYQTDKFRLSLSNAKPNSTLYFKWQKNGQPWFYPGKERVADGWTVFGQTDSAGRWVNEANFTPDEIGSWYEWAMVDGKISRVIGFQVVAPGVNVGHSSSVAPVYSGGGGGGGSSTFTPCTLRVYCERLDSGQEPDPSGEAGEEPATKTPGPSGCQGEGFEGYGQVAECLYPDQDPNDICRSFDREWRSCNEEIQDRVNPDTGSINTSGLPECGGSGTQTGEPCLYGSNVVRCTYSDQTTAIRCGSPASGEYCLPGYTPAGCVSPQ